MSMLAIQLSHSKVVLIDWQDFHIFSNTQKNTGECAIVNCQPEHLWVSEESSSTPSASDSCQVHIDILGIQDVPNTFNPA